MFVTLSGLARRLAARVDERLCARDQAIADRLGWQTTTLGFGRRAYRDPRFDLLPGPQETTQPDPISRTGVSS